MRKVFLLFSVMFLMISPRAKAQQFEGIEVYGGYSYLQDNLSSTFSPFYSPLTPFGADFSLSGWQASITEKATDWLGLVQEFAGYYGTRNLIGADNHFSSFSILSGPRFYYPGFKAITPFVHALFGYDTTSVTLKPENFKATSGSYAMAFGGGVDVSAGRTLAIRAFQFDYYRPQSFGSGQNNWRVSAGFVFRFGGRRR